MRLTIIPLDKAVYVNGLCYTDLTWAGTPIDVHALQWFDVEGWIEFNDGSPNQSITELPQWALNAEAAWIAERDKPAPDPLPPTAEQNKATAIRKLQETDWATIPDVADPNKSNPYLVNPAEYLTYRNTIRQYAINPVAGNIDWAIQPTAIWSS